jgi:nicotinamide-nucleotide amidase
MNVYIITIGDELLVGQVVDSNSAKMASYLALIGARVVEKITVSDQLKAIKDGLQHAHSKADVILITGGLGPTKDDITKKALAEYFNTGFVFHQETWERIQMMFGKMGLNITEAVKNQCWMPQNAIMLKNKLGTAPGMWFEEQGKVYVSMPGVPFEMEYLMEYEVVPKLANFFHETPFLNKTVLISGEGESAIAERLKVFENNLPGEAKLAYLPGIGQVRLRLTVHGSDNSLLKNELDLYFESMLKNIPVHLIAGVNFDSLQVAVGHILKQKGLKVGTAESCTGGYLSHLVTSVPGSSEYYSGSVIAYSNDVKMKILGVKSETLEEFGAVSEETVIEMIKGCCDVLGVEVAAAISGIAGPDGDTAEKPVGTVWIAVGNAKTCKTKLLKLGKDRIRNIQYASAYALNHLRLFVQYPEII